MVIFVFSVLAVATAFVVYGNIKNIFGHYNCIDAAKMKAYKLGQITEDERRQVTIHLGVCEKCQQAMIDLDPDLDIDIENSSP